jgi:hypothetical protein
MKKLVIGTLFFYCLNLIIDVIIWMLFGNEIGFLIHGGNTYLLPLMTTCLGLLFGMGIPLLLYKPNRKLIFVCSQIIMTVLFCFLMVVINYSSRAEQKRHAVNKNRTVASLSYLNDF